jgi:hypothetical protein
MLHIIRTMNVVERYSKNTDEEQGGLEVVTYWTNGIIVRVPSVRLSSISRRGRLILRSILPLLQVRLGESRRERSEKGFMEYIPDEFVLKLHVRTKSESSKFVQPPPFRTPLARERAHTRG